MIKKNKMTIICLTITFILLHVGCKKETIKNKELKKVTLILDWVPNTNHTGLYAAKDKGFYTDEKLDVNIIQPSEGGSADLVAAGQAEFGISYQEQVTYAKTSKNPLPIKAIAAIIQHNTSGFASPVKKGIKTPKNFEGKIYGGWGSPMEIAMLNGLMKKYNADFNKLKQVDIGAADFFASVEKNVDFTWIYYGWDGIAAEKKNFPINFIKLQDVDPMLDFYTPVIITRDSVIENNPELIKAFLRATSKGYYYSIKNPGIAVDSLLKFAPEIDKDIALASQNYLSEEYSKDASRWGEMKPEIWTNFSEWMFNNGLLEKSLTVDEAFTNEFLPKK